MVDQADGIVGSGAQDVMSPRAVMKKMHVTPQQQRQLLRIVAAGMKVMFDEKTHSMMIEQMRQPRPVEQNLSQGIVILMGILWKESKGSMPPELIIPAAMVLLAEAADFMNKAGQTVTLQQFGAANEMLVDMLLQQAGVSPDKLAAKGDGAAKGAVVGAAMAPTEPAPPPGGVR